MRHLILSLFALFCLCGTAKAAPVTLYKVYEACATWSDINFSMEPKSGAERVDVTYCLAYMQAWRDAAHVNCIWKELQPDHEVSAAFHRFNNLSPKQLAQLTVNYAKSNPEKWEIGFASLGGLITNDVGKCN